MSRQRLLGLLGLVVLGLITLFLRDTTSGLDPLETLLPKDNGEPDYYIEDAQATAYNVDGSVRHRLNAIRLTHYPATDLTTLEQPRLLFYDQDGIPWHIEARNGQVLPGGTIVELHNDVEIRRMDQQDSATLRLLTTALRVDTEREYAETDQPVTIILPEGTTHAVGMQAFLQQDRVKLLANVRGQYEIR